jgi:hypothetical protein
MFPTIVAVSWTFDWQNAGQVIHRMAGIQSSD